MAVGFGSPLVMFNLKKSKTKYVEIDDASLIKI